MSFLSLLPSHKNQWRVCTSEYIDTFTKARSKYITSVAFTCSFIIIIQMAEFMFFALNQRVLESTSGMKNSAFVNPCDNCFCVVFHVLKYKWSRFFKPLTNHVSSCQSKNVLWWVEWSRLLENGDFYSHFEDELSTCL